jgi:superfamily II DNA or RNA helicase
MAEFMTSKGLKAATALGNDTDRAATLERLRSGELQVVFTVDALSEGVDVPEMDTALFLRPTASPTVFLQQLGRGLRLSPAKRCLTVLDYVSIPHRDFRMDRKYTALLGGTTRA